MTKPTKTHRAHMVLFEDALWCELKVAAARRNTTVSAIIRDQAQRFLRGLQRRGAKKAGGLALLLLALSTSACATGGLTLTPQERALPLQVACDLAPFFDPSGLATVAVCGASLLQQVGCRRTP
jgi:hypothetical protein